MAGRIVSEKKAPEVVEWIMRPFNAGLGEYFGVHLDIHKAHVAMLADRSLVSRDEARTILGALNALGDAGAEGMGSNLDTDLYMQMESFVTSKAGDLGGKMHMGRSRNDLYACAARLMFRRKLVAIIGDVLALQQAVLAKATTHATTVMPGYTHLQHAEPITLGHYLVAFFDALDRDVARAWGAYRRTNLNALGASALSASSFDLDRDRTAALLGFDGLVENSYDAVAARDYIVEATAMVATLASTIARVADSFIVWSTSEFDMVDLPDGYAYTSSIMPQKRNPGYFLESVRSKSARVSAGLMGVLMTLKGTTFAQSRDTSFEITVPAFDAFREATAMVNVMRGVIDALIAKPERMEENCAREFSGATEVANAIVRERGLPFRSAYKVVATLVRYAAERKLRPVDVSPALVDEAALEVLGHGLGLPDAMIHDCLDPSRNVEMKKTVGGPSKASVEAMLARRETLLAASVAAFDARNASLASASAALNDAVATLTG